MEAIRTIPIRYFVLAVAFFAFITVLPIVLMFGSWALAGFEGEPFSEGGDGHGTYLWLLFYSIPVGGSPLFLCTIALLVRLFAAATANKVARR